MLSMGVRYGPRAKTDPPGESEARNTSLSRRDGVQKCNRSSFVPLNRGSLLVRIFNVLTVFIPHGTEYGSLSNYSHTTRESAAIAAACPSPSAIPIPLPILLVALSSHCSGRRATVDPPTAYPPSGDAELPTPRSFVTVAGDDPQEWRGVRSLCDSMWHPCRGVRPEGRARRRFALRRCLNWDSAETSSQRTSAGNGWGRTAGQTGRKWMGHRRAQEAQPAVATIV